MTQHISTHEFLERAARGSRNVEAMRADIPFKIGLIRDAFSRAVSSDDLRRWAQTGQIVKPYGKQEDSTNYQRAQSAKDAYGGSWCISAFADSIRGADARSGREIGISFHLDNESGQTCSHHVGEKLPSGVALSVMWAGLPALLDLIESTFPGVKAQLQEFVEASRVYNPL